MQVLINVSAEEIKTLQNMKEIRDESDIVFCLHELISRATTKEPGTMVNKNMQALSKMRTGSFMGVSNE